MVTPYLNGEPPPRKTIDGVSPVTLEITRKAMQRVVYGEQGTGWRVHISGSDVQIAAKTGTAQVPNRDNDAWFVAFAPAAAPSIAVAVVVEGGGSGGTTAGPIARQVIEAYLDQGGTVLDAATAALLAIR